MSIFDENRYKRYSNFMDQYLKEIRFINLSTEIFENVQRYNLTHYPETRRLLSDFSIYKLERIFVSKEINLYEEKVYIRKLVLHLYDRYREYKIADTESMIDYTDKYLSEAAAFRILIDLVSQEIDDNSRDEETIYQYSIDNKLSSHVNLEKLKVLIDHMEI